MSTAYNLVSNLRVSPGDPIKADHHNRLVQAALRNLYQRGSVKGRLDTTGFIPRLDATAVTDVDFPFNTAVDDQGSTLALTFTPGTVNSIMASIGGVLLDQTDSSGNPPFLQVDKTKDFAPYGTGQRCLIFLKYSINPGMNLVTAEPVALGAPPASAPYLWHKLVGILLQDASGNVTWKQMVFFNQGFAAITPTHAGYFVPIAWAAS